MAVRKIAQRDTCAASEQPNASTHSLASVNIEHTMNTGPKITSGEKKKREKPSSSALTKTKHRARALQRTPCNK